MLGSWREKFKCTMMVVNYCALQVEGAGLLFLSSPGGSSAAPHNRKLWVHNTEEKKSKLNTVKKNINATQYETLRQSECVLKRIDIYKRLFKQLDYYFIYR